MADFRYWNAVYVNGRPVQDLCLDCQTRGESAEAERRLWTVDHSEDSSGFDCRIVAADEFREYVDAIPDDDDGPIAPNETFCGLAPQYVGFQMYEHKTEPALITVWIATVVEPDHEHGVQTPDGIVPRLDLLDDNGALAVVDGDFGGGVAFMRLPIADWMEFERAFIVGKHVYVEHWRQMFEQSWANYLGLRESNDS
jgi:hypothetical protein